MFGQIAPTPYDLRFSAFGVSVRVHPVFWLSSIFLAWDDHLGDLRKIFLRVICIFVSVLVHELGHALMNRSFGFDSEIVLYFFGGYATSMRHSTWKDIAVSAAGPVAGFLLFAVVLGLAILMNLQNWFSASSQLRALAEDAVAFSLFINLAWNAINLLPVLPLDGGQISRELFMWFNRRRGMEYALLVSMVAAGAVALWCVRAYLAKTGVLDLDPRFLALMFGYLAYQSYLAYAAERHGYR